MEPHFFTRRLNFLEPIPFLTMFVCRCYIHLMRGVVSVIFGVLLFGGNAYSQETVLDAYRGSNPTATITTGIGQVIKPVWTPVITPVNTPPPAPQAAPRYTPEQILEQDLANEAKYKAKGKYELGEVPQKKGKGEKNSKGEGGDLKPQLYLNSLSMGSTPDYDSPRVRQGAPEKIRIPYREFPKPIKIPYR